MADILFAACDVDYFNQYGKAFAKSAIVHGNKVHIHVINPTLGMDRIEHPDIIYSFEENAPADRSYYASSRFLIAPDLLLQSDKHRFLLLDIDCVIRSKIELPWAAVGLYIREPFGANEWERRGTRVAAGAVMYDSTAWLFAKRVADRIRALPNQWFIDQVALAETMDEFGTGIKIHDFAKDEAFLDWEFRDDGVIWTAKGNRKADPRFLDEKRKYEDIDL